MPGLSFAHSFQGEFSVLGTTALRSLPTPNGPSSWKSATIRETPNYFLGYHCQESYPVAVSENADYLIAFEGRVYGQDFLSVTRRMFELGRLLWTEPDKAYRECARWISSSDGEFVAVITHKPSNSTWVINDLLGRLPVYYYATEDSLVLSRELRFITELRKCTDFDRMAIAHHLIFGYPLGKKTLLKDVCRLQPGALLSICSRPKSTKNERLCTFNFDDKPHAAKTTDQNVAELLSLFIDACQNRSSAGSGGTSRNVVALSGGLDSRSVAACLARQKIAFSAVTRVDSAQSSAVDARVARVLGRVFNIKWEVIDIGSPQPDDVLTLLRLKTGLNPLGMVSRVQFLEKLEAKYGSDINFFTGDGGDKVFHDLRPGRKLKSIEHLSSFLVSNQQVFDIASAAKMSGIPEREIANDICNHIVEYPEKDLSEKYVHFLIFERAFKWLFEGEDRNRCFFWSVSPFYSIPLFRYAMGCSDSQKHRFALYKSFLLNLSTAAAAVENANWGFPITSKICPIFLMFQDIAKMLTPLTPRVQALARKYNPTLTNGQFACIQRQTKRCREIRSYLPYLELADPGIKYSRANIDNLLTLTSVIEDLKCGASSLIDP